VSGFFLFYFFISFTYITPAVVFTSAYEQLFSFSFHLLAFTKTAEPALRQSRREKPSALLYRLIIKPQHLWLECYFFFVSSNKEKVTKKKMPPSAVFFYTHSLFTPSWYSLDLILKPSCLHLCLSHVAVHSFIRKATAIHCGVLPVPFIPFAEYPFLLLCFLCFNSKGF